MQRVTDNFVKELEKFAIGVQSFSRLATDTRRELHIHPHQPRPIGRGMPRGTASIPNVESVKQHGRSATTILAGQRGSCRWVSGHI